MCRLLTRRTSCNPSMKLEVPQRSNGAGADRLSLVRRSARLGGRAAVRAAQVHHQRRPLTQGRAGARQSTRDPARAYKELRACPWCRTARAGTGVRTWWYGCPVVGAVSWRLNRRRIRPQRSRLRPRLGCHKVRRGPVRAPARVAASKTALSPKDDQTHASRPGAVGGSEQESPAHDLNLAAPPLDRPLPASRGFDIPGRHAISMHCGSPIRCRAVKESTEGPLGTVSQAMCRRGPLFTCHREVCSGLR